MMRFNDSDLAKAKQMKGYTQIVEAKKIRTNASHAFGKTARRLCSCVRVRHMQGKKK